MPKVSVVVPIYNVEKYLEECLDSLVNQTLEDIEIICVNDGSTDNSLNILKEYAKKDNRILIINQENKGVSVARNNGLKKAIGEYVSFMDSDDYLDLSAYEKLYWKAHSDNLDLIMFQLFSFDDETLEPSDYHKYLYRLDSFNDSFEGKIFSLEDIKCFLFNIPTSPCNKLYKRELLEKNSIKFEEGLIFEDNPFFYEVILKFKRISILKEPFYKRRIHEHSTINRTDKRVYDLLEINSIIQNLFIKEGIFEIYKTQIFNWGIMGVMDKLFKIDLEYQQEFYELIKNNFKTLDMDEKTLKKLNNNARFFYQEIINSNSYNDFYMHFKIQELIQQNKKLKKQIKNNKRNLEKISNTKPYKLAYFLRRFSIEFIRGTKVDKKNFIKWIYYKIISKKSSMDGKYNPLI